MKNITKNNLELNLNEATSILLEMARNSCWNDISENTEFIISEIKNDSRDFKIQRIEKHKVNRQKKPITIENATIKLRSIYDNLYDINLEIYKSTRAKTIIDIRYYPKSSLNHDYYEKVKNNAPLLHCKLGTPPHAKDKSKKYDVNWDLNDVENNLKSFWNKIQFKLK